MSPRLPRVGPLGNWVLEMRRVVRAVPPWQLSRVLRRNAAEASLFARSWSRPAASPCCLHVRDNAAADPGASVRPHPRHHRNFGMKTRPGCSDRRWRRRRQRPLSWPAAVEGRNCRARRARRARPCTPRAGCHAQRRPQRRCCEYTINLYKEIEEARASRAASITAGVGDAGADGLPEARLRAPRYLGLTEIISVDEAARFPRWTSSTSSAPCTTR
jgi:hypothetical protein